MKVLLVRLGSLGDIVHALPVAAALRDRYPDARLDWLVDARHSAILDLVPIVDRRIVISPSGPLRRDRPGHPGDRQFAGRLGILSAVRWLRQQQYDVALDLQGLIKSAVLARATGASRVIGFDDAHLRERQARAFYTETVIPQAGTHVVSKNLAALPALAVEIPATPRFPIDVPFSPAFEAIRPLLALDGGAPGYALINPGAAWPNKRWPADRFGAVAAALAERHGLPRDRVVGPGRRVAGAGRGGRIERGSGRRAADRHRRPAGDRSRRASSPFPATPGPCTWRRPSARRSSPCSGRRTRGATARGRRTTSASRVLPTACVTMRGAAAASRPCIDDITIEDVLGAIERRLAIARRAHA